MEDYKKDKILPLNSYIRNPPKVLKPKQVIIFQAIRYSLDICDIAYERLIENLFIFTENQKINQFDFPYIFSDVWTIINQAVIFKNIICTYFNQNEEDQILTEINKAKKLRDSHQHLDERITEILSTEDLPIYGSLTWVKKSFNSDEFTKNAIYSGTVTDKKNVSMSMSNKIIENDHPIIGDLEFTGIVNVGNRKNKRFKEQRIFITHLINDLKKIIAHFDLQVQKQVEKITIKSSHVSDIHIQLLGKCTDEIPNMEDNISKR